jgi:hypothetical protein
MELKYLKKYFPQQFVFLVKDATQGSYLDSPYASFALTLTAYYYTTGKILLSM